MCLRFLVTLYVSASTPELGFSTPELGFIYLLYHQSEQARGSLPNVGDATQLFCATASLFFFFWVVYVVALLKLYPQLQPGRCRARREVTYYSAFFVVIDRPATDHIRVSVKLILYRLLFHLSYKHPSIR